MYIVLDCDENLRAVYFFLQQTKRCRVWNQRMRQKRRRGRERRGRRGGGGGGGRKWAFGPRHQPCTYVSSNMYVKPYWCIDLPPLGWDLLLIILNNRWGIMTQVVVVKASVNEPLSSDLNVNFVMDRQLTVNHFWLLFAHFASCVNSQMTRELMTWTYSTTVHFKALIWLVGLGLIRAGLGVNLGCC